VAAASANSAREVGRSATLAFLLLCSFGSTSLPAQTATPSSARDTVSPIPDALCRDMRSTKVLNPGAPVGCERLRLVRFSYMGFDGAAHDDGELVALDAVADHVLAIFVALRSRGFPIASAKLMNHYRGNDDASMAVNNTSAFNVRRVEGTNSMSLHAYGLAIDLNPIQNPYVERGARGIEISPPAGKSYVRRQDQRPGMAEAVIDLFAHHGFAQWGGYWPRGIDYQHFQVGRRLAAQLVTLPYPKARAAFEQHVERVRACIQAARQKGQRSLGACAG
jgi:D-alanyl-D-alanine carboxypeptidase